MPFDQNAVLGSGYTIYRNKGLYKLGSRHVNPMGENTRVAIGEDTRTRELDSAIISVTRFSTVPLAPVEDLVPSQGW